ncbi:MAG: sulfite exporter TauE/SafE family protein [Planctomycetaceae bacterium]|jgi:uncharacterized membrane protein YfcA|nr:sulfite exporter TauE/SafE family protein [Planctomycetaceae bacterium]
MSFTIYSIVLGSLAAFCFGMSKSGVPGLGLFGVILMANAFVGDEKNSTGAVLPLLVMADAMAVGYYIRNCNWQKIRQLVLPVLIGLFIGGVVLDMVNNRQFCILLGIIILTMIALDQVRIMLKWNGFPKSRGFAWTMGIMGGASTVIGNAGGPVMTLYIAAQGFSKEKFMGTFAVFFFLVNISKLPIVAYLGMITPRSLLFDLCLLPAIIIGSLVGRRAFLIIPEKWFMPLILILNALSAVKMLLG